MLLILIVATSVLYFATGIQSQAGWATELCRYGAPICKEEAYFYSLATATAVIAIFFLLSRLIDI